MIGKNKLAFPEEALSEMEMAIKSNKFNLSEESRIWNARLYVQARDAAIVMGTDVGDFPKSIGDCKYQRSRK